jgi:hypothetical protein
MAMLHRFFARKVRNNAVRVARQRSKSPTPTSERGFCLREVRECYNVGPAADTAALGWKATKLRGHGRPPRGAVAWWVGGTPTEKHPEGAGHVAICTGWGPSELGDVFSTDIKRGGWFDRVAIEAIHAEWPKLRYVGWSKDINGVRVIE